jgi:hypothetical protein
MSWLRILMAVPLAALVWGCVEQEPDRPTVDDKRIIKQNILTKAPAMKFRVNADLEGKVTYLGLDVDRDVIQPGEQFTLTHYWRVHKRVDGWKIFVHLNGPNKKGFINADHKPIGGRYPATKWKPGEIVRDQHKVTLPNNWKEPKVMVFAGLWKGKLRMKPAGPKDAENRVLAATLPVGAAKVAPTKPKRLVALQTKQPVKLDGVLDEEVWGKAASSGVFVNTLNGGPVPQKTEAKVIWDDKHLYVGFHCQDEDVWSSLDKRDDKLWTQEAVEMFIDANGDGKDYIELQINPTAAIFDSYLPEYRKNQNDWNSKLVAKVKVGGTLNKREDKDDHWSVEIAIPWADVKGRGAYELELPPKPGALWKVNFFRMDQPKGKPQQASAWSPPMVGDFHVLAKFGELAFADEGGKIPAGTKAAGPVARPARVLPGGRVVSKKPTGPVGGLKRVLPKKLVVPLSKRRPQPRPVPPSSK